MSRSEKDCAVKKTKRVVCKDDCGKRNKSKKKQCHVCKRKLRRRTIKIICKQAKAPVVNLTTPPPEVNVLTNPPDVLITTPPPIVNIDTPKPDVHVKVETPKTEVKVKVDYPDDDCMEELRDQLRDFRNTEIELITTTGAGAGAEPPNRIGILEKIGKGTITLRPTTGNTLDQVVIYSLCHIVGFRPFIPVGA